MSDAGTHDAEDAAATARELGERKSKELGEELAQKLEKLRDWMLTKPEEMRSWDRVKETRARVDELIDECLDLPEPKRTEVMRNALEFRELVRKLRVG